MVPQNRPPVSVSAEFSWAAGALRDTIFRAFVAAFQSSKITKVYRCVKVSDINDPEHRDLCGLCLPTGESSYTLYIATTSYNAPQSEDEQVQTLIHELIHAVIVRAIGLTENEESTTRKLELALWHLFTPKQKRIIRTWLPEEILDHQPLPVEYMNGRLLGPGELTPSDPVL